MSVFAQSGAVVGFWQPQRTIAQMAIATWTRLTISGSVHGISLVGALGRYLKNFLGDRKDSYTKDATAADHRPLGVAATVLFGSGLENPRKLLVKP
jgi:hypothetical protein